MNSDKYARALTLGAVLIAIAGCSASPKAVTTAACPPPAKEVNPPVYLYSGGDYDKNHYPNMKLVATFNASKWLDENMTHCQKMLEVTTWQTEFHYCVLSKE